MKQQGSTKPILSQDWQDAIRNKFENMSVLQLKKQKIKMVKDLEQINALLDGIIEQQTNKQHKVQDIDKQIQRYKKLRKGLKRSLQNFQFMLTGDYSVKADQQIIRLKNMLKIQREQVNKFNRMLAVPMQKDIQICEELQKELFQLQKQIQELKVKNIKRKQQIQCNTAENQKKASSAKILNKEIQKLKQHEQSQGLFQKSNQNASKAYQQLLKKREKILSVLELDQKKNGKLFRQKIKKLIQLDQVSEQLSRYLNEIQKTLQQKIQQFKQAKRAKIQANKKQRNSESNVFSRRRNRTQQNSQIQTLQKQRQIHYKRMSRVKQFKQKSSYSFVPRQQSIKYQLPTRQTSDQLLPKLYQAVGKNKFQIEEDCDVKDLLYV